MRAAYLGVTYGPMLAKDQERIANLNYIYNTNAIEAVQMLRIRRAPFYNCYRIASTHVWKSKLLCFFMLSAITRDSELCTTHSGDP
jgi:hypothetical protein